MRADYSFIRRCREDPQLELNEFLAVFYNLQGTKGDEPEKLAALLDYMRDGKAAGSLEQKIQREVVLAHEETGWALEYMARMIPSDDIKREGRFEVYDALQRDGKELPNTHGASEEERLLKACLKRKGTSGR